MATEKKGKAADEHVESALLAPANLITKAARTKTGKTLAVWLFMIGFVIAVIAGLINALAAVGVIGSSIVMTSALMGFMALIGLIVGIVNISDKEAIEFLIGAIAITGAAGAMLALANLGAGTAVVGEITNFFAVFISQVASMLVLFISPAALIVGLKVVYGAARN